MEISGGTKADRTFLECFCAAERPGSELGVSFKNFRKALEILPLVRTFIEAEDYPGLLETIEEELADIKNDTRVQEWLNTEYKCRQLIEAQKSREPMNQQSRMHSEWAMEMGRLYGWYESISATLSHLRKTVFEPNEKKLWAVEILHEHIKDRIVWEDQEIKRLKQEIAIEKIVKSVLEARKRKDDFVELDVIKDGEHCIRRIPTAVFFMEDDEPIII
jgi:hypothetical protein